MRHRRRALVLAAWVLLAAQGCTYRAWYEGFQERQRQECYEHPSHADAQNCVDRVNRMTYDEYRKSRENSKLQPE